eukprot:495877_1
MLNHMLDHLIEVDESVEGLGFDAILVTVDTRSSNKDLDKYLSIMNAMTQTPLNSYSTIWNYLLQNMTVIAPTKLYSSPPDSNMVSIPFGVYLFNNTGVEIE